MSQINNILRIDASARYADSVTRSLTDEIINQLASSGPISVIVRDVAQGLPFVDEAWVGANFTPPENRSETQRAILAESDALVEELQSADTLIIGLPIYNFGIPASLKAWIDMIARARLTFKYTENGPVGLLTGKKAIIAIASGGINVDSDIDFATPYIRHALAFIGIHDVTVIASDAMGRDADKKRVAASQQIKAIAA